MNRAVVYGLVQCDWLVKTRDNEMVKEEISMGNLYFLFAGNLFYQSGSTSQDGGLDK
jgi:hypothetical protein